MKKDILITNKEDYISRDFSWLQFNSRVLYLAMNHTLPLKERMNFFSIAYSNLSEFCRVRLSFILNQVKYDPYNETIDGKTMKEEMNEILDNTKSFRYSLDELYNELVNELKKENIHITKVSKLNKENSDTAKHIFYDQLLPTLAPISYESTRETPFIRSGNMAILIKATDKNDKDESVFSFVPIPKTFGKIINIDKKENIFITLDDLIKTYIGSLFYQKKIEYCGTFRILREADVDFNYDTKLPLVERMKDFVFRREVADPIFVEVEKGISEECKTIIKKAFNVKKRKLIVETEHVNLNIFDNKNLKLKEGYSLFEPQEPKELVGVDSIIEKMEETDILLCHPYESYDSVIRLVEEAAEDPHVLIIRNTLYRVSSDQSPLVNALCEASRNGKQVCVLIELKARFDEQNNLKLINKLISAGVQISYGVEGFKVHCKMLSVVKREEEGLKFYTHIGTGNYNDKTAKLYSDLSYFTCDEKIGQDVIRIFNFITGYTKMGKLCSGKLLYSPMTLKPQLKTLIEKEVENSLKGKCGRVIIKCNSISDKEIIDCIYRASALGVKFDIICRGICSMKPINNNIHIKSIVGRFLEHSRIYYFYNDGKPKIYIGSADLMSRNLNHRIELLVQLTDKSIKRKLVSILELNINDTENTFYLNKKGNWKAIEIPKDEFSLNVFEELISNSINKVKMPKLKKKI